MNPNVEVPMPKTIEIVKLALPEYNELRKFGQKAPDIPEPILFN